MSTAPSQRQLRVGELIRHALAETLARGEVNDPDLDGVVVSIPEVRMSPDLKHATCFVMPLGGRDATRTVEALGRNRRFLRGVVAKKVNLKFAADLHFRVDDSFDRGAKIDEVLRSDPVVRRDIGAAEGDED